ncbi:unnamed protein product [Trifolium pratense]|uniref:Uncharacterized protein n=1 Tax=Trifolium pratense TaxID=57577 RepID=A0ACB0KFK3_TRIPR|nr:unnamed protein product [Trifolium pratense]
MYDLYVNDLLLHDVKVWDIHKIHSLFPETVAESIIRTPLFEEVKEDKMVWNYENHGEWSSLWRISAPPKTKHLLWRICRGCLPSRVRLKERNESATTAGNVAMVVWCIWHNRNNWVWNGVKDTAKEVAMRAVHMVGEWSAVNRMQQTNGYTAAATANSELVTAESLLQQTSQDTALLR